MKNIFIMLMFSAFFVAAVFAGSAIFAKDIPVIEEDGIKMHIFGAKLENFAVTSVLLEGKADAVLINAQFSKEEAQRVVEMIKGTGKNLAMIYISHHDPDFYFGLGHIADAFPEAKIYSTPQTAYLIDATKEAKLALWGPQLKENAPSRFIVPEPVNADHVMLEDIRINIVQRRDDPDFSYLWIPSLRTILGGTYLYNNMHVWMADLQLSGTPDEWLRALDDMTALNPRYAIPGHAVMNGSAVSGTEAVAFTREYIAVFEREKNVAKDSAELIAEMKSVYPDLKGEHILELGAKVRKGETVWKKITSFPPIGRKAEVRLENGIVFELDFKDNKRMSFVGKTGEFKDVADNVEYTAVWISEGIYMVYWSEPAVKANVVHVEDFNTGTVYSNISLKGGTFLNLKGTITLLE